MPYTGNNHFKCGSKTGDPPFIKRKHGERYSLAMNRLPWITAASIIDKHGEDAVAIIASKLKDLERDLRQGAPGDDFEFWCATARALIEILRGTRTAGDAAH
jgi:hypothetical protein